MKVLLIGFGKIAYMPYMHFYLESLKEIDDKEIDLIYWDRDGKPDVEVPSIISNAYKFEAYLEEQLPFYKKIKFFINFRIFSKRILKNQKYDKVIILHSTPGLTLLDYLLFNYKGRYILDFRDVSHEDKALYRYLIKKLVLGSALTFVSSNAFRKFLPNYKNIYTIHNFLEDSLNKKFIRFESSRERKIIRVSYWGLVRQVKINVKVMNALGNDSRFELHYYGRMQQDGRDMEQYAIDHNYSNVYFHGQYMPSDRYLFACNTELIHNFYDCGKTSGNAMGNKYYDGIIFGIPQLCTIGSHMGKTVLSNEVGYAFDLDSTKLADEIFSYYNNIDWKQFKINCESALKNVLDEQHQAKIQLLNYFAI